MFRARQGARGPGRVRGVLRLLRARQRIEEDRVSATGPSRSSAPPGCRSACARRSSSPRGRVRLRQRGTDIHRRPAALGLDADRADSRLALRGRRHDGARGYPAAGAGSAGPGAIGGDAALPRRARQLERRAVPKPRRGIPRGHARVPHRPSLASSTRCRTTFAISLSFI